MTEVLGAAISSQLQNLTRVIESYNKQGDVSGLFGHHILKGIAEFRIEWDVICDSDWVEKSFDEKNVYNISSLGYSLSISTTEDRAKETFVKAFDLLKQRDLFKSSHASFPFQPSTFLGLVLGVKTIEDENWRKKAIEWLSWIFDERIKKGQIPDFYELFYKYIKHHLRNQPVEIRDISPYTSIEDLSFLEYGMIKKTFQTTSHHENLKSIRKNILKQLIETGVESVTAEKAAVIFAAVNESITKDIDNLLISPHFVSAILSRFEDAMKRWRYDSHQLKNPVRWPVNEEREVQDILWIILRSYFDDLVDEETLPKVGHSSYKPDFAIPSLRLLVEAKFTYKKEDFKKIEKEIMEDSIGYLINTQEYDKIIVFIYDKSASVQEHGITKNALVKIPEIEDVIIVSKPSQLP